MAKFDWTACDDPDTLLDAAKRSKPPISARKQRLLGCGFCRHVWDRLEEPSRRAVEASERFADDPATAADLTAAYDDATRVNRRRFDKTGILYGKSAGTAPADRVTAKFGWEAAGAASRPTKPVLGKIVFAVRMLAGDSGGETAALAALVRCVYGDPLTPLPLDPAWRTDAAVGIAAKVYDSREFGNLPVLADALQDAGCELPAVLDHCRLPGPHARGCWVIDWVLGHA